MLLYELLPLVNRIPVRFPLCSVPCEHLCYLGGHIFPGDFCSSGWLSCSFLPCVSEMKVYFIPKDQISLRISSGLSNSPPPSSLSFRSIQVAILLQCPILGLFSRNPSPVSQIQVSDQRTPLHSSGSQGAFRPRNLSVICCPRVLDSAAP